MGEVEKASLRVHEHTHMTAPTGDNGDSNSGSSVSRESETIHKSVGMFFFTRHGKAVNFGKILRNFFLKKKIKEATEFKCLTYPVIISSKHRDCFLPKLHNI